jgi:hypothetical protein
MPFNQGEPDPNEVRKWFLDNPPVPDGTFELALVLGGTVSAGAYTAGALDFLIEALDCWEAARANGDPLVPRHRVVLRVITGASGGGVNAAIAARALNFDFPHIAQGTAVNPNGAGNPFYDTWIRDLTLNRFLETSDVESELISILNGRAIDEAAAKIIAFAGPPKQRPWVAAPLRLIVTLTNLAGVPYRLDLSGGSETFVNHADYMRFAVNYPGQPAVDFRPDELILNSGQGVPGAIGWDRFSEFAKATAAFPAGFPPRELTRPAEQYRYRILAEPNSPPGQRKYLALTPDWAAMLLSGACSADGQYFFLVVDGGATDNEPIELARTALCGILDRNPRDPETADRAVLLIDPFAGKGELGRQTRGTFVDNLGSLVSTVIQQTRYDSRDVVLAADENVFSRFMLTPRQQPNTNRPAITSTGLAAFIGFACPAFMRYDYMLGRRNCRDFLLKDFALAANNSKVFGGPWNQLQKDAYARGMQAGFLPIIPLTGTAAQPQELDQWPAGKLKPEDYRDAIEDRFRAILKAATPPAKWLKLASWAGGLVSDGLVADKVIDAMNDYLREAELS